jgi:hypothetical protein
MSDTSIVMKKTTPKKRGKKQTGADEEDTPQLLKEPVVLFSRKPPMSNTKGVVLEAAEAYV